MDSLTDKGLEAKCDRFQPLCSFIKKQLYPFNQLNISLTDNFEATKEAIMSKAMKRSK